MNPPCSTKKPLTWRDLQAVMEIQQGLLVLPQLQELRTSPNEGKQPDLLENLHFHQEIPCHEKKNTHTCRQRPPDTAPTPQGSGKTGHTSTRAVRVPAPQTSRGGAQLLAARLEQARRQKEQTKKHQELSASQVCSSTATSSGSSPAFGCLFAKTGANLSPGIPN